MSIVRSVVFVVTLTAPLLASSTPHHDSEGSQHASHTADVSSELVEQVRRATESFRDVNLTNGAGYAQVLGCVSGPQEGAMGVHFVNSTLLLDGVLDVAQPEALIYEFTNGIARLVGVEYIVFADAWHLTHAENDPPVLGGQLFNYYASPNRFGLPAFYELHVWAWRDNPNGAFVDWNPRVTCEGQ
jgi:hypothetical protein